MLSTWSSIESSSGSSEAMILILRHSGRCLLRRYSKSMISLIPGDSTMSTQLPVCIPLYRKCFIFSALLGCLLPGFVTSTSTLCPEKCKCLQNKQVCNHSSIRLPLSHSPKPKQGFRTGRGERMFSRRQGNSFLSSSDKWNRSEQRTDNRSFD